MSNIDEKTSQKSKEEKQGVPTPKQDDSKEYSRIIKACFSIVLLNIIGLLFVAFGTDEHGAEATWLFFIGGLFHLCGMVIFPFQFICKLILRRTAKDNENK